MATKAKKAPRKKAEKKAPKKATPKRKAKPRKRSKPKGPVTRIESHPFAPGTNVQFLPVAEVEVERSLNRAPIGKARAKAKVAKDGSLEVRGLDNGMWAAAGPINDQGDFRFVQFSVKSNG
jgi:hypothetical protein